MSYLTNDEKNIILKKSAASASIFVAIALIIIKFIGVICSDSLAVMSSMIDSLADLFASCITFMAIYISSQPADKRHRYGHGKAESLSALLQSAFIIGSACFVSYDAIIRIFKPQEILQTNSAIIIMLISLALTLILICFQIYVAKHTNSPAIKADALHYQTDILTNISIIFSLLIIKFFNIYWLDTLTAFIISSYLIHSAYLLAKEAFSTLMDKELEDDIRQNIIKTTLSCSNILGVHDLRTHNLGCSYMIEMHLELDGNLTLYTAHQYTVKVEQKLKSIYPTAQIIIHQDPTGILEPRLDDKI